MIFHSRDKMVSHHCHRYTSQLCPFNVIPQIMSQMPAFQNHLRRLWIQLLERHVDCPQVWNNDVGHRHLTLFCPALVQRYDCLVTHKSLPFNSLRESHPYSRLPLLAPLLLDYYAQYVLCCQYITKSCPGYRIYFTCLRLGLGSAPSAYHP